MEAIAASGLSPRANDRRLADRLRPKPPRSAWRLDFGSGYAEGLLERYSSVAPEDIVATLTRFTAIDDRPPGPHRRHRISSGADRERRRNPNRALMANLGELLPPTLRLTTSTEFGIPARFKEAIKFGTWDTRHAPARQHSPLHAAAPRG